VIFLKSDRSPSLAEAAIGLPGLSAADGGTCGDSGPRAAVPTNKANWSHWLTTRPAGRPRWPACVGGGTHDCVLPPYWRRPRM